MNQKYKTEIDVMVRAYLGDCGPQANHIYNFVQAVLAKWSTPAEWLEQAYREGWAACRDAETIGEESEDWSFGNSTANSRMIDAQQAALTAAPQGVAYARLTEFPAGAIVNGRTHIDRLESFYRFDCEAGPLINCGDWHGLKRCFEHLAERASHGQAPAAQADSVLEDAARWRELREQHEDDTAERCCVFAPNDMRECLVPVGSLPGELDAFIDAERAARKQGAKHD